MFAIIILWIAVVILGVCIYLTNRDMEYLYRNSYELIETSMSLRRDVAVLRARLSQLEGRCESWMAIYKKQ